MHETRRILHVVGTMDIGGVETRLMEIYEKINRTKFQFDFVVHSNKKGFYEDKILSLGGKIYRAPDFYLFNFISYAYFWRDFFLSHKDLQIIHGHKTSTAFIYFSIARKLIKYQKLIAHSRNSRKSNKISYLLSKLSRYYATHFLAVSYESGLSEFGKKITNNACQIIYNSYNFNSYKYSEILRKEARDKYNLNSKDKLFIHIGSFTKQKNHIFLLKIFKKINELDKNSYLMLIGKGKQKNKIYRFIKKLNISNKIFIIEQSNNVKKYLSAADLMIFPSLFEGFPGVAFESQLNGLGVLMSDRITNKIVINRNVEKMALEKSVRIWASQALKMVFGRLYKDNLAIKKHEFEIQYRVNFFEKYYE